MGMKLGKTDLRIDPETEERGVWIQYSRESGVEFRLREFTHPAVQKRRRDLVEEGEIPEPDLDEVKGAASSGDPGTLGETVQEMADRVAHPALLAELITDWAGVYDEDDDPVPYSPEACRELFSDPGYKRVARVLVLASVRQDHLHSGRLEREGND